MPELDEIYKITKRLYIGAYWPRLNFKKFKRHGITAIVNLMEDNLYTPPRCFDYLHKGFKDETYPPQVFVKEIFDFMDVHLLVKEGKVLVHCSMGISRSGAICAGWLLKEHPNWTWNEAVDFVRESRMIFPAVEIRESILDYLECIEGKRRFL